MDATLSHGMPNVGWKIAKLRGLRIERDKEALIKDHGGVSAGHANFAIRGLPVYDLCGGHITGRERGPTVKPNSGSHADEESPGNEVVLEVVGLFLGLIWSLWRAVWRLGGLL